LLGRVSSTANVLRAAALPVGALAGGIAGQYASPRAALGAAALTFSLSSLWIVPRTFRVPASAG
ncbi:MAG TPA: MFS transporter, partial [Blastocatellia bacterium]|nr:MFS transporter [Blastocatellia bacterium]